jgi:uncharacterized membrane protein (DUF485 family)
MATATHAPPAEAAARDGEPQIDWESIERSPEFRQLARRKRAFVLPATIFFLVWYFGFIVLAGYAPDFMGETFIWDGMTVGYALALSQFVMVWGLGAWYLRKADREFDPLAAEVVERAHSGQPAQGMEEPERSARPEHRPAPTGKVVPR